MARFQSRGRTTFSGTDCRFAGLGMVGCDEGRQARSDQNGIHRHEAWEIYAFCQGAFDWWIDGRRAILPPRAWLLVPPGMPHGDPGRVLARGRICWLHLMRSPAELLGGDADLRRAFAGCVGRVVPASGEGPAVIQRLLDLLADLAASWPAIQVRVLVETILLAFLADAQRVQAVDGTALAAVLADIDGSLAENISVAALARRHGLGEQRLRREFQALVGLPPAAYRQARRIATAKDLLESTDLAIQVIAQRLGYATAQHFATLFRRATGSRPGAWRQGHRQRASEAGIVRGRS